MSTSRASLGSARCAKAFATGQVIVMCSCREPRMANCSRSWQSLTLQRFAGYWPAAFLRRSAQVWCGGLGSWRTGATRMQLDVCLIEAASHWPLDAWCVPSLSLLRGRCWGFVCARTILPSSLFEVRSLSCTSALCRARQFLFRLCIAIMLKQARYLKVCSVLIGVAHFESSATLLRQHRSVVTVSLGTR